MKTRKHGLIAFFLLICIVCAAVLGLLIADKIHSDKEMSEMHDVAYGNSDASAEDTTENVVSDTDSSDADANASLDVTIESDTESTTESGKDSLFVDINALQDTNPDIFAWIKVPGTKIDYPVVQHPVDDEYYLKHGADGMSSSYGCPFIEACDSKELDQFNTVIYGHNMNDGSMFAGLHDFENQDFYDNHREILICSAEHVYSYEIFAAVMYSDAYIPGYFDDTVASDRAAFIESLQTDIVPERSILSEDVNVDENSKIITLSTCDRKLRDNRFIVVGVLKKIDGQDV